VLGKREKLSRITEGGGSSPEYPWGSTILGTIGNTFSATRKPFSDVPVTVFSSGAARQFIRLSGDPIENCCEVKGETVVFVALVQAGSQRAQPASHYFRARSRAAEPKGILK
jgi:hypothetical protein